MKMSGRNGLMRRLAASSVLLVALLSATGRPAAAAQGIGEVVDVAVPAQARLLSVTSAGARLVAVGVRGVIILSDDGGVTWRQARSVPVTEALTNVRFSSDQVGWAVGHGAIVLGTTDGGETWKKLLDGTTAARLVLEGAEAAPAPDQEDRIAFGRRMIEDGPDKPFLEILTDPADPQGVTVLGAYNLALRTTDGGGNWAPLSFDFPNPGQVHLYGAARHGLDVYIAGELGLLLHSSDGGHSYEALESPYEGSFFGVLVTRTGAVVAFGLKGNIYRSDDRGSSWSRIEAGAGQTVSSGLVLADGTVILISQVGGILRSTDDARHFERLPLAVPGGLTAVAQASDGGIVISGLLGIISVSQSSLADAKLPEAGQ